MKKLLLAVVALVFLVAGCAAKEEQAPGPMEGETGGQVHMEGMAAEHPPGEVKVTKRFADSLAKMTDNNLYNLEMVIPAKHLQMGVNNVEIIVHDAAGSDVSQAELTITPWMPDKGRGVMQKPVVTERGDGLYSVENIVLSMTGHWQLRVNVAKDDKEDSAVFDFPEVKAMGQEHAMMHAPPPKDLDYSTTRMTANKTFEVTYKSVSGRIRVNRIHSWELSVKDADGQPINDAEVTVVGDMPGQGQGLPIEPVVKKMGFGGLYRIEGMEFSMPGWWVVTINVKTDDEQDSVSFNLNLP
jgi:hypothetical protein